MLNYYGGKTILIPTTTELSTVLNSLVAYERQQNTDMSLTEILKDLDIGKKEVPEVLRLLILIPELLQDYDFKREVKTDKK